VTRLGIGLILVGDTVNDVAILNGTVQFGENKGIIGIPLTDRDALGNHIAIFYKQLRTVWNVIGDERLVGIIHNPDFTGAAQDYGCNFLTIVIIDSPHILEDHLSGKLRFVL